MMTCPIGRNISDNYIYCYGCVSRACSSGNIKKTYCAIVQADCKLVSLYSVGDRFKEQVWSTGGMIPTEKNGGTPGKICCSANVSIANRTRTLLKSNPHFHGDRPATNRLNQCSVPALESPALVTITEVMAIQICQLSSKANSLK
jgi:hypothetical protein